MKRLLISTLILISLMFALAAPASADCYLDYSLDFYLGSFLDLSGNFTLDVTDSSTQEDLLLLARMAAVDQLKAKVVENKLVKLVDQEAAAIGFTKLGTYELIPEDFPVYAMHDLAYMYAFHQWYVFDPDLYRLKAVRVESGIERPRNSPYNLDFYLTKKLGPEETYVGVQEDDILLIQTDANLALDQFGFVPSVVCVDSLGEKETIQANYLKDIKTWATAD